MNSVLYAQSSESSHLHDSSPQLDEERMSGVLSIKYVENSYLRNSQKYPVREVSVLDLACMSCPPWLARITLM